MVSQLKPKVRQRFLAKTKGWIPDRTLDAKVDEAYEDQTSQTMRDPPEGLGGVPVRMGEAGEDED